MIGKLEFDLFAAINAKGLARADRIRDPAESNGASGAILKLIADQVAAFRTLNPNFDAHDFIRDSGVGEDWMASRIIGWADGGTTASDSEVSYEH